MDHAPGITVRELLPPRGRKHALPEWEVRVEGRVIGRVRSLRIGSTPAMFFCAYGMHPETGREVDLEANTDFYERVDTVRRFTVQPETFARHLR